ncbi:hypothetical protein IE53DRAFT_367213 [Violaceomyces palustris]|uniref:Uncharacterized protein n=1 Tax=Violaceomyces palustris TaxID=1673888 RepID=A0ACD0P331_9BASI|nr:hypothetical protein IE53DRAFT_367213 [Violaceomyces palustris]
MSRSLRSRPMTLYSKDDQPNIPNLPGSSSNVIPSSSSLSQMAAREAKVVKKGKKGGVRKAAEVGSNLKKRLSMRYAEPTELGPGGLSAIPQVPSLPSANQFNVSVNQQYMDKTGRSLPILGEGFSEEPDFDDETYRPKASFDTTASRTDHFAGDFSVDVGLLSQDDFDPQAYLRAKLSHQSESSLRNFQSSLAGAKEAANEDLKRQVFKNYSEFITISKEIATLENDMLELKELLAEWKQLPQALELDDAVGATTLSETFRGKGGRGNRASMIDLQQIYRAQITSLWEGIEGSQKFLPYVPGRHLIAEASTFTELNAATYKPRQGVALFLLDDLLLVAVRKKRQMSSKVRLVAERCFSLGEIVVIDLKDGGDLTNAVKIKRGKETFVYRTDRTEDKRALLNAFRRVAEELANKRRKESNAEAEARKRESTLLSSPSIPEFGFNPRGGSSTSGSLAPPSEGGTDGGVFAAAAASAATEKKDPGRWINDFADELAVCIALREWDEAVTLIEKGKGVLSTYSPSDFAYIDLSTKLASRTNDLVSAISSDFSQPNLKKSAVVRNASYLLRLDKGERARELFLNARTELLRRRVRQIKFEGDVSLYISELALVHFTLVKNTSEWYMSAFKDNRMASAQIEAYAEMFRRQVYGVDQDPQVISEAMEISMSSAAQLKDVGLDFSYLIEELLRPEGLARPIPALTLTLADADEVHDSTAHRAKAQEIRRQSMMNVVS